MAKVIIERRYETWCRSGKTWSNWFKFEECKTLDEAKERVKELKKRKEPIKSMKGDYRIAENEKSK